LQIFDWLRKERPEALNKLVPVCGDITLHELGISQADQKILVDSVSVVFHSAATVKFDEALKLSVGMNIMGTKRIAQLCHKMVKLEVSSAIRLRHKKLTLESFTQNSAVSELNLVFSAKYLMYYDEPTRLNRK
jgi:thioester reductase-like protein